ncbi:4-aminobutyrate aminotransferase/(S)-3-amino-2-methylpropionate transaminase [Alkalispirillum mobile]|uniref:4-aminobutyrate aminotransferase/(S)-3-amino-2-methylpropionate transaminase n=1 Tax=Alkalispirillum mobile TaxID=85925 RepID=A0A498CAQ0_9GAMM|nr:aspartate aminotransferase family protein [Alkalispirillum mobile]RLK51636.1 4-aminobutyrate aminotransferase/(S)-3-amino-2-methylpropionate transaminase [Alkalispirillum mobile]
MKPHRNPLPDGNSAIEAPSTAQLEAYPGLPRFTKGQGCWLFDADGHRYFDATAGSGALNLGHNHPQVVEAAIAQTRNLIHTGSIFHSDARDRFVARLGEFSPFSPCTVLTCVAGTEAVEAALKVARAYTGRTPVISFSYAYHGKSTGGLSVTWRQALRKYSPQAADAVQVAPYPLHHDPAAPMGETEACLDELSTIIGNMARAGAPPAALILEPVASSEGVIPAGNAFLQGVQQLARNAGALLIFDELWTGMGRCGVPFYGGQAGLEPDLILVGKSVANGFPISAVLGSQEILASLPAGLHTATFAGHPVGCAAGSAVIDLMQTTQPWVSASDQGEALWQGLKTLQGEMAFITGLRGEGLLLGFDCVDETGRPSPEKARTFAGHAQEKGLLLAYGGRQGNTVKVTPPLTMDDSEREFLMTTLDTVAKGLS